jgi:hypothetical protein
MNLRQPFLLIVLSILLCSLEDEAYIDSLNCILNAIEDGNHRVCIVQIQFTFLAIKFKP